ncbi:MAG: ABC transporter substrate-binding protein [Hyphomicrobiales bacterium]|nr:ABC transporter substrate-binding protein [Hyphomicrobiales bacterium]
MKTIITTAISASLLGAGLLAGSAAMSGEIRVGVTLRMISDNGQKQGEMIADEFEAINEAGGINGHTIKLTLLNDECKSDKGVANANRLVYQEQVHLVIGSSCSSVTLPIVAVTAGGETPQIIPHSTSASITQQGSEWIFRVPISARFYKGVLAKYIGDNVGTRVAYMYVADEAARSETEGLVELMRDMYGVEPLYIEQGQEKEIDFRSNLLAIKDLNPDAIYIAGQAEAIARFLVQSYEVGIPDTVARAGSSAVSVADAPILAGDAIKGVFYSAAYSDSDTREIAQEFNKMVLDRYGVESVDHDFSQAWDLLQIVKLALGNADLQLTDDSLAADRTAIRDALANIKDYEGLASGPISFCADPTPECRDGNRTPVLISYISGGKDFEVEVLDRVTMPIDFGL